MLHGAQLVDLAERLGDINEHRACAAYVSKQVKERGVAFVTRLIRRVVQQPPVPVLDGRHAEAADRPLPGLAPDNLLRSGAVEVLRHVGGGAKTQRLKRDAHCVQVRASHPRSHAVDVVPACVFLESEVLSEMLNVRRWHLCAQSTAGLAFYWSLVYF